MTALLLLIAAKICSFVSSFSIRKASSSSSTSPRRSCSGSSRAGGIIGFAKVVAICGLIPVCYAQQPTHVVVVADVGKLWADWLAISHIADNNEKTYRMLTFGLPPRNPVKSPDYYAGVADGLRTAQRIWGENFKIIPLLPQPKPQPNPDHNKRREK